MDHGTPQLFILFYRRRTPKITGGLNIFSNSDDIDPRGTFKLHRTHKSIDVADFHWDLLQPRPLLNVAASETRRNDTPARPSTGGSLLRTAGGDNANRGDEFPTPTGPTPERRQRIPVILRVPGRTAERIFALYAIRLLLRMWSN